MSTPDAHPTDAGSRLALLRDRSFLSVWIAGAGWNTIHWLELLAVGVFVFERTGSPFLVALMGVLRIVPFALFGALAGAMGARVDRRLALLGALASMVPMSVGLGLLAASGHIEIWHIALASFIGGMVWALDFPVRKTLIAEIVEMERVGAAMALDSVTSSGSRMLGPVFGGLLLELVGLQGMYYLSAALYTISAASIAWLPAGVHRGGSGGAGLLSSVLGGLAHLRTAPALAGIMTVTIVLNLWGFPVLTMIPVIGEETLGLSAFPVGLLASAEGAGALLGAIALALWARMPYFRRIYMLGTCAYLLAALAFGCSKWAVLSGVVLLAAGLASAGFGVMQSSLVVLNSPLALRGHMMGVLSVCIGMGPVGFLHVGVLASWLGAPLAVIIITLEGLVALAWCLWRWPELRAIQISPETGNSRR